MVLFTRQDHIVENRVVLLLLHGHLSVYLADGLQRLLHRFVPIDTFQKRTVISRNTYLVKLFEVRGVDREKLDTLVHGQARIFGLQQHPVLNDSQLMSRLKNL